MRYTAATFPDLLTAASVSSMKGGYISLIRRYAFLYGITVLTLLLLAAPSLRWPFYTGFYASVFYPVVRWCLDHTFGLLPFNAIYLLFAGLVTGLFFFVRRVRKEGRNPAFYKRSGRRLLHGLMIIFCAFYWLWGFHYTQPGLVLRLGLVQRPIKLNRLTEEASRTLNRMLQIRESLRIADEATVTGKDFPSGTYDDWLEQARAIAMQLQIPAPGTPRVRMLYPKGLLQRINTSGFYNPFTGECNVEADLHPLLVPFVIQHELMHGFGLTDEGDCNFAAFLSCVNSPERLIEYAGLIEYWRYLMYEIRKLDKETYDTIQPALPAGIRQELEDIRANLNKYPEFFPELRNKIYHNYLRAQGIQEGMASYNRFIQMVIAYKDQRRL